MQVLQCYIGILLKCNNGRTLHSPSIVSIESSSNPIINTLAMQIQIDTQDVVLVTALLYHVLSSSKDKIVYDGQNLGPSSFTLYGVCILK